MLRTFLSVLAFPAAAGAAARPVGLGPRTFHARRRKKARGLAYLDAYIRLDPDSPEGRTAKQIRADAQRQPETAHP